MIGIMPIYALNLAIPSVILRMEPGNMQQDNFVGDTHFGSEEDIAEPEPCHCCKSGTSKKEAETRILMAN